MSKQIEVCPSLAEFVWTNDYLPIQMKGLIPAISTDKQFLEICKKQTPQLTSSEVSDLVYFLAHLTRQYGIGYLRKYFYHEIPNLIVLRFIRTIHTCIDEEALNRRFKTLLLNPAVKECSKTIALVEGLSSIFFGIRPIECYLIATNITGQHIDFPILDKSEKIVYETLSQDEIDYLLTGKSTNEQQLDLK